jgi:hypothetical protein
VQRNEFNVHRGILTRIGARFGRKSSEGELKIGPRLATWGFSVLGFEAWLGRHFRGFILRDARPDSANALPGERAPQDEVVGY